ncbi:MAG: thioredoxin family protein, partial [Candidatus Thorarchaeota archaeon]|nr:thioredoxin family protein [Candidatus Thorarchaeota archaeon]
MAMLSDVQSDAPDCGEYMETMSQMYKGGFLRQRNEYKLNPEAIEKLGTFSEDYRIVIVFADWCSDARRAVPVMSLIEAETGQKISALGGMKKPPYGSDKFWAVPPSPVEVDIFEITSSPTILIFNQQGEEVGRIKTRAKMTPTIEQEIVKIIE